MEDIHCRNCGGKLLTETEILAKIEGKKEKREKQNEEKARMRKSLAQVLIWAGDKPSFEEYIGWKCDNIYSKPALPQSHLQDRGIIISESGQWCDCTQEFGSECLSDGLVGLIEAQPCGERACYRYGIPVKIAEVQPKGWPQPRPKLEWWPLLPTLSERSKCHAEHAATEFSSPPTPEQLAHLICRIGDAAKLAVSDKERTIAQIDEYFELREVAIKCTDSIRGRYDQDQPMRRINKTDNEIIEMLIGGWPLALRPTVVDTVIGILQKRPRQAQADRGFPQLRNFLAHKSTCVWCTKEEADAGLGSEYCSCGLERLLAEIAGHEPPPKSQTVVYERPGNAITTVVHRAFWLRGRGRSVLSDITDEGENVLGFHFAQNCGISQELMKDVTEKVWERWFAFLCRDFYRAAQYINDDPNISDHNREEKLIALGSRQNPPVVFKFTEFHTGYEKHSGRTERVT